ncbi:MAG: hypothetical protein E7223_02150 [Clostridiales bacterium]|nr:hypothetical protein [Clostridiales bacterium]
MSLFSQWEELINGQTDETFEEFWKLYAGTEQKIYKSILAEKNPVVSGTFQELVDRYEADPVIFMGFLDGINTSLESELDLAEVKEDTAITLNIVWEKLFFNMLKAKAEYLYTLEEWAGILSEEEQIAIVKDFKRSGTVRKEKEPGRNDPCPCGSGKKYKKCCGANK